MTPTGRAFASRYNARLSTVESLGDAVDDAESAGGSPVDDRVIRVGHRFGLPASAASAASSGSESRGGDDEQGPVSSPPASQLVPAPPLVLMPVHLLPGAAPYARDAVLHDPSVWLKTDGAEEGRAMAPPDVAVSSELRSRGPAPALETAAAAGTSAPPRPPPASSAAGSDGGGPDGTLSTRQLGHIDTFIAAVERLGSTSASSSKAAGGAALAGEWLAAADPGIFSIRGAARSAVSVSTPYVPPPQLTVTLSDGDSATTLTEPVARYLAAASAKATATSPNAAWLQRMTALDPLGALSAAGSSSPPLVEDEDEAVLVSAAASIVAAAKSRSVVLQ